MNAAQQRKRSTLAQQLLIARRDGRDTTKLEAQIDRLEHEATMQSNSQQPRQVVSIEEDNGWSFLKIFSK